MAGRKGAIFHIRDNWVGSAPEVVVADSMTREDILAIAPRLGPDSEIVIVTGRAGTARVSQDYGVTWSRMVHPDTVVAVGDGGTIVRSTDRGGTWEPIASGTQEDLRALSVEGARDIRRPARRGAPLAVA